MGITSYLPHHTESWYAHCQVGQWHHLAFVYDAEASEQRIYVDGALDAIGAHSMDDAASAVRSRVQRHDESCPVP